jgi:hypothetical protein
MVMNEVWKDIIGYEGLYKVSDLGRVMSMPKKWIAGSGVIRKKGQTLLKLGLNRHGYYTIVLCKEKVRKTITVHRLVYEAFNGKTDLQIDHKIEGNKLDNRLCNLQALTQRENVSKNRLTTNKTSQYTGVIWYKNLNKWRASITINGKSMHLGYFMSEKEAAKAYSDKLKEVL